MPGEAETPQPNPYKDDLDVLYSPPSAPQLEHGVGLDETELIGGHSNAQGKYDMVRLRYPSDKPGSHYSVQAYVPKSEQGNVDPKHILEHARQVGRIAANVQDGDIELRHYSSAEDFADDLWGKLGFDEKQDQSDRRGNGGLFRRTRK